jgi:PPOX class probable F420-dependent enzyme
VTYTLP